MTSLAIFHLSSAPPTLALPREGGGEFDRASTGIRAPSPLAGEGRGRGDAYKLETQKHTGGNPAHRALYSADGE